MRRCILAILLAAPALAHAQAPPKLPDYVAIDLQRRLAPVAAKYGLMIVIPREPKGAGRGGYSYDPVAQSESQDANDYVNLFIEELSKYPVDFLKASGLRRVLLVQALKVGQQTRAAVPDADQEDMIYDVTYVKNQRYSRHVVHHELYHLLEANWNDSFYYKDPNWAMLNDPGFTYGEGGAAYQTGNVWAFTHPRQGFINVYATSGLEEDKAEVWAVMFVPENWKLVQPFLADDPVLRAKVAFLREYGRSRSKAMNDEFWKKVDGETTPATHLPN